MRVGPDDDITTNDGRSGIVIGVHENHLSILDHEGAVFHVPPEQIATINQQETRPRAGAFPTPMGCRPLVVWSREEIARRYPKAEGR